MTRITDNSGTRWVEIPRRKRRKSPRALRFAEIKLGDQLVKRQKQYINGRMHEYHFVVVAMWFDPVDGHSDPESGQMVGIQRVGECGVGIGRPQKHTRRALAYQQFHYSEVDYIELCRNRLDALKDGTVVGIGKAAAIRRRPRMPGAGL